MIQGCVAAWHKGAASCRQERHLAVAWQPAGSLLLLARPQVSAAGRQPLLMIHDNIQDSAMQQKPLYKCTLAGILLTMDCGFVQLKMNFSSK